MKKVTWEYIINKISESNQDLLISLGYWVNALDFHSEVFSCLGQRPVGEIYFIEGGEEVSVGFFRIDRKIKSDKNLIERLLNHQSVKFLVANPSSGFIDNLPYIVKSELNEIGEFDEEVIEEAKKITGCDWFFLNDGNEYDEPIYCKRQ